MSTAPLTGAPSTTYNSISLTGTYNTNVYTVPANTIAIAWIIDAPGLGSGAVVNINDPSNVNTFISVTSSQYTITDTSRLVNSTTGITSPIPVATNAVHFYMFPGEILNVAGNGNATFRYAIYALSGS